MFGKFVRIGELFANIEKVAVLLTVSLAEQLNVSQSQCVLIIISVTSVIHRRAPRMGIYWVSPFKIPTPLMADFEKCTTERV